MNKISSIGELNLEGVDLWDDTPELKQQLVNEINEADGDLHNICAEMYFKSEYDYLKFVENNAN